MLADCTADTVILCAGTCEYLDRGEVDAELVARVMTTNFIGPVNCLAALQPQLVSGNRVVLVSSMAHWLHFPRAEAYGASKAALTRVCRHTAPRLGTERDCRHGRFTRFCRHAADPQNDFPMPGRVSVGTPSTPFVAVWQREGSHRVSRRVQPGVAPAFRPARCTSARTAAQDGATMKIAIIGSGIAGLTCAGGSPDITSHAV